jgi:hypothetical protein
MTQTEQDRAMTFASRLLADRRGVTSAGAVDEIKRNPALLDQLAAQFQSECAALRDALAPKPTKAEKPTKPEGQ